MELVKRFFLIFAVSLSIASFAVAADLAPAPQDTSSVFDDMKFDYDEIIKAYEYDHSIPLNIEVKEIKDFGSYEKIYFSYDSLNGGKVPAVLFMPKERIQPMKPERSSKEGGFPVVFFMHFHVSDKSLADMFATWPGYGIAVMAIDGVFRGERKEPGMDVLMPDPWKSAAHMQMQVKDILRGFDVIAGYDGLDHERMGYMGISMGALTGTVATAMDERIKSIIIADGAADFSIMFRNSDYGDLLEIKDYMDKNGVSEMELVDAFKYVEPAIFAPHFTDDRMVLFQNGITDTTMSVPAMQKLHKLIGTEKNKVIWYDSGHILPFDKVVSDSLKWFRKTL